MRRPRREGPAEAAARALPLSLAEITPTRTGRARPAATTSAATPLARRRGARPAPPDPDDAAAADQVALRLLARTNHSQALLRAKLIRRGFSESAAAGATERAARAGFLDDRAFAEALVERRTQRSHWGRGLVARELAAKGIDDTEIERVLTPADGDEGEELGRALHLAAQRMRGVEATDYEAVVARVGPYLQRRGYAPGIIRRVCRHLLTEAPRG
jgi:regulatory protein